MNFGKIKLFPLALLALVTVFYLIATDNHGWYIYILLGFVLLERSILQAALVYMAHVQKKIAEKMVAKMTEILAGQPGQPLSPPFDQEIE